jgi:hypothetical protein
VDAAGFKRGSGSGALSVGSAESTESLPVLGERWVKLLGFGSV